MSDNATSKRRYNKIAAEHLAYAKRRFQEFASTSAVRDELKAQGAEYPHSALHYYWHQNAKRKKALGDLAAIDQQLCVCAETSSRNCGVHAGDAQDGGE